MNNYKKPFLIAEIGCNHMGQLEIAKDLINLAKMSGASVAKFQKRDNIKLLSKEQYNSPHPNPNNSYGKTYGEHREFLEFSIDIHKDLKLYCEEVGIDYATSVWDIISASEVISLDPKFIKVPSACNNNEELLKVLRDEYQGEVHISVGMTNKLEEETKILKNIIKKINYHTNNIATVTLYRNEDNSNEYIPSNNYWHGNIP